MPEVSIPCLAAELAPRRSERAKGVKVVPINDETHFNAVRNCIKRHEKDAAAVMKP